MLHIRALSKRFGAQTVFEDLSWTIGKGVRIGLVGPNGTGKTTLLRILVGLESPDSGEVTAPKDALLGYLPQEVESLEGETVLGQTLSGFVEVRRIEEEIERIEVRLASRPDAEELGRLTGRYGDLRHRLEALGGYRLEGEARAILGGLGFETSQIHAPLTTLSGGWRMRAALAGHLLRRPDVLLLDEPTNHLDLESLAWLEDFLDDYEGSLVIVSHDRFFLNRVVDGVAELEGGRLSLYAGDYDDYQEQKEARHEALLAAKKNQDRQIAEAERFIERFRYKATKARQVQSRVKRLAKVERIRIHRGPKTIHFTFPQPPRSGAETIRIESLDKAFGQRVVYSGADFVARRGERIALLGPNGAGKTTLLKVLAGVLEMDAGWRSVGHNVTLHYYAQHQLEALGAGRTVLEEIESVAPDEMRPRLRTILGAFLFSGDDVDKKVAVLSGGEKARLALSKMLVRPASLLLLDEPTNHLDLRARAILEEALDQYTGTIVFISHDRYFINRIATAVCAVGGGGLDLRPGGYDDYLDDLRLRAEGSSPSPASQAAERGTAERLSKEPAGGIDDPSREPTGRGSLPSKRTDGRIAPPAEGRADQARRHATEARGGSARHGKEPAGGSARPAQESTRGTARPARETARGKAGPERKPDGTAEPGRERGGGIPAPAAMKGGAGSLPGPRDDEAGPPGRMDRRQQKRLEAEQRQRRHDETKGFKERLAAVEQEIRSLETRLHDVEAALADPALYRDGARARDVNREHKEIQERIAWLYDEWASLEETLSRS